MLTEQESNPFLLHFDPMHARCSAAMQVSNSHFHLEKNVLSHKVVDSRTQKSCITSNNRSHSKENIGYVFAELC